MEGRPNRSLIAQWRLSRGMTREELAQAVGRSVRTIYRWEAGTHTPNEDVLLHLAAVLGVPPQLLLSVTRTGKEKAGRASRPARR